MTGRSVQTPPAAWAEALLDGALAREGAEPCWMEDVRAAGAERFRAIGFPGAKDEEWRFTNVAPIILADRVPAPDVPMTAGQVEPYLLEDAWTVVFVNGRLIRELSRVDGLPQGVFVGTVHDAGLPPAVAERFGNLARPEPNGFACLNTACFRDAAVIAVPRGIAVERPIQVLHVAVGDGRPSIAFPRTFVMAASLSRLTLVEAFASSGAGVCVSALTEMLVAEDAAVDHYRWQGEAEGALHVDVMVAEAQRASVIRTTALTAGAALSRSDVMVRLAGEGAEAVLNGLYVARDHQHMDHHTRIDHLAPRCPSHELYKGILDDHGRAVFSGRIFVQKDAQKTDAKQTNQNLLLSRDAWVDTKPQLEIFADDVRCTHGATVGRLSDDALFYCRSRGIPQDVAEKLLIYAFAAEILERIQVGSLRARMEQTILGPGVQMPR